jgi:hypothetical protein
MDRAAQSVAKVPSALARGMVLLALVATFPYSFEATTVVGIRLTNWLTLWVFNLTFLVLGLTAIAVAFFVLRAIVAYVEEGRWPRKAAGVEVGEVDEALKRIERDADTMSAGAVRLHEMERNLQNANELIRYLHAELERVRGSGPAKQPRAENAEHGKH